MIYKGFSKERNQFTTVGKGSFCVGNLVHCTTIIQYCTGAEGTEENVHLYLDMESFDMLRYNTAKALSLTTKYQEK